MSKSDKTVGFRTFRLCCTIICRSAFKTGILCGCYSGAGRDTLFLARCVGNTGKVFAFDIQAEAVKATQQLLCEQVWSREYGSCQ